MRRVAIVTSHPIQYQAPWFRALARVCDVTVFFCHRQDADGQARAGFGRPFEWDVPVLDGYRHEWLDNVSADPRVDRFAGCDTPDIKARLAAGSFEACIVSGWYLKSYLQAVRACRQLGVPVLMRGDSHLGTRRSPLVSAIKRVPYRWWLRRMEAHLYVGRANRAYLQHYGVPPDRLFFVPHAVDNDRFAADAERARQSGEVRSLRTAWGAGDATAVFLLAGKFIAAKRAADFIRAAAALAREGGDIRAVLVGAGPEDEALRRRAVAADPVVAFDGFQNQARMGARYAAADCLVLPSQETWGLVVNEAMATGLPAIVADAAGCGADLIEPGVTGCTYPVGDTAALAARMREAMAWRGSQVIRDAVLARIAGYSCEAAVTGTLQALDAVVPSRPRGTRPAVYDHA